MLVGLRRAGPADAAAIEVLVDAAYAPLAATIGRKPAPMLADYAKMVRRHQFWVLGEPPALQAVIELLPRQRWLWIENVAVRPDLQGNGIGQALLAFAEHEAARQGLPETRLLTNERWTRNLQLYRTVGYQRYHVRPRLGGRVVYLRKTVAVEDRSAPSGALGTQQP